MSSWKPRIEPKRQAGRGPKYRTQHTRVDKLKKALCCEHLSDKNPKRNLNEKPKLECEESKQKNWELGVYWTEEHRRETAT